MVIAHSQDVARASIRTLEKIAEFRCSVIVTVTPNPGVDRTLTVSKIVFDSMVRATETRLDWGGKGFNVSRALKALGVQSVAMGLVGGAAGSTLASGMADAGIPTDLVRISGETRTNTVITEAGSCRYVKVNEAGPQVSATEVESLIARVRKRVKPGDFWVFSGSLPPGVPDGFYATLIRLVQQNGAKALLDASGPPLASGIGAFPYLVKPNAEEAAEVTGSPVCDESDALRAARMILRRGAQMVALTLAERGVVLASAESVVVAKPPLMQARNPVGAGDALMAGLVLALERGLALEEAARWAVASGTAAAVRSGVSVGSYAEVNSLHSRVATTIVRK